MPSAILRSIKDIVLHRGVQAALYVTHEGLRVCPVGGIGGVPFFESSLVNYTNPHLRQLLIYSEDGFEEVQLVLVVESAEVDPTV